MLAGVSERMRTLALAIISMANVSTWNIELFIMCWHRMFLPSNRLYYLQYLRFNSNWFIYNALVDSKIARTCVHPIQYLALSSAHTVYLKNRTFFFAPLLPFTLCVVLFFILLFFLCFCSFSRSLTRHSWCNEHFKSSTFQSIRFKIAHAFAAITVCCCYYRVTIAINTHCHLLYCTKL